MIYLAFETQQSEKRATLFIVKWLATTLNMLNKHQAQEMFTYLKNEIEAGEEGTRASSYWSRTERPVVTPAEREMQLNSSSRGVSVSQMLSNACGTPNI